ncbi:MAG: hypothetical protein E5Y59_07765, partial [Mesorhizobium sp.]
DWVEQHGLDAWLDKLVATVVMPVFHLLVGHGIATEAHGQNLILIHRDGWPVRLAMRDFHDSVEYVPGFLRDPSTVPDFLALNPAYRDAAPHRQAALGLFQPRIRTESLLRRKLAPPGTECAHEIPNSLAVA